jgi:hypothetical protein
VCTFYTGGNNRSGLPFGFGRDSGGPPEVLNQRKQHGKWHLWFLPGNILHWSKRQNESVTQDEDDLLGIVGMRWLMEAKWRTAGLMALLATAACATSPDVSLPPLSGLMTKVVLPPGASQSVSNSR